MTIAVGGDSSTPSSPMTPQNLPEGKQYHVFFSNSQHNPDVELVAKWRQLLVEIGFIVYTPEKHFSQEIPNAENTKLAIQQSVYIAIVLSAQYVTNKLKQNECEFSLKLSLDDQTHRVVLLRIDSCLVPEYLSHFHHIDATQCESKWLPKFKSLLSACSVEEPVLALPSGKQYHVFFLYRTVSPDKDWVQEVAMDLESSNPGFKCAFHERDFLPGRTIFENITDLLHKSLKVVVVLTPDFLSSTWTKYESELAHMLSMESSHDVSIIPVLLQNCEIPKHLISLTYLDATDTHDMWWPRLLSAVNIPNEDLKFQGPIVDDKIQTMKMTTFGGRGNADLSESWLIDIGFSYDNSIIVADAKNKKLKRFTFHGILEHEATFTSRPMFFTQFGNELYVVFPDDEVLRVLATDTFEVISKLTVPKQCSGIAKISDSLIALVVRSKCKIRVINRFGKKIRSIKPLVGINEVENMNSKQEKEARSNKCGVRQRLASTSACNSNSKYQTFSRDNQRCKSTYGNIISVKGALFIYTFLIEMITILFDTVKQITDCICTKLWSWKVFGKKRDANPGSIDPNDSEEEADCATKHSNVGKKDFEFLKRHRTKIKETSNKLKWPGFIATSGTDKLFVTDYETRLLTVIHFDEHEVFFHKSLPLVDPRGLTVHGEMLFVAAGSVRIFDLNGEPMGEVPFHGGPVMFPRCIAIDRIGRYMALTHKGDGDDCISVYQLLKAC